MVFCHIDRIIVMCGILEGCNATNIGIPRLRANYINGLDWYRKRSRDSINRSMWNMNHMFSLRIQRNPQNDTFSQYWLNWHRGSQDQWPRMTFEESKDNAKNHMWSYSDLFHLSCLHSCQWEEVVLLETRFRWKIGQRLLYLWRHISVTWPDPVIFLPKAAQRMPLKLYKIQPDPLSALAVT